MLKALDDLSASILHLQICPRFGESILQTSRMLNQSKSPFRQSNSVSPDNPSLQQCVGSPISAGKILGKITANVKLTATMNSPAVISDPERFDIVKECTESYEVGDANADWPNNILSRHTVVYSSGIITRAGNATVPEVDAAELERCRVLAAAAKDLIDDTPVGMGSESEDTFLPFFICHRPDAPIPTAITEDLIRDRFGGTIFPPATITTEPLVASGIWWEEVTEAAEDFEDEEDVEENDLTAWHRLIDWFANHAQLLQATFVRIGDSEALEELDPEEMPAGTEIPGSVLPRMAVALTPGGSLVGLFGYTVQT